MIFKSIFLASDHRGIMLKNELMLFLGSDPKFCGVNLFDIGTWDRSLNVDYQDYSSFLCRCMDGKDDRCGILICASGIGMSIASNRFKEIRAALCHNEKMGELAREHNDANVLVLGAEFCEKKTAIEITRKFLLTSFRKERYASRVSRLGICPNNI